MSLAPQALLLQEVQEEIQRARDDNVWWPMPGGWLVGTWKWRKNEKRIMVGGIE